MYFLSSEVKGLKPLFRCSVFATMKLQLSEAGVVSTQISLYSMHSNLQSWSKVLGRYQFPPSPKSMLEYQLHTVRNGHLLTPTLIQGVGGIIATHNINDSLEIKQ